MCFQSVIVKSIERNSRNMYLARLLLLGLHPEGLSGPLLKAATTKTHSSAGLGLTTLGKAPALTLGYCTTGYMLPSSTHNSACPGLTAPGHAPDLACDHCHIVNNLHVATTNTHNSAGLGLTVQGDVSGPVCCLPFSHWLHAVTTNTHNAQRVWFSPC